MKKIINCDLFVDWGEKWSEWTPVISACMPSLLDHSWTCELQQFPLPFNCHWNFSTSLLTCTLAMLSGAGSKKTWSILSVVWGGGQFDLTLLLSVHSCNYLKLPTSLSLIFVPWCSLISVNRGLQIKGHLASLDGSRAIPPHPDWTQVRIYTYFKTG